MLSKRRRRRRELLLALAISLLVNHGLLGTMAYLAATSPHRLKAPAPAPLEVELEPAPPGEPPTFALPTLPRPRPQLRSAAVTPPEQRPEEKKAEAVTVPPREEDKPKEKAPAPQPEQRLKMVEVNNPESDKPPENARYLSDKNRRVEEETRAVHTNLEKDHPHPRPSADPSAPKAEQPGSDKPKIAETREQEGKKKAAEPKASPRVSPLLTMRGQSPEEAREAQEALTSEKSPDGTLPGGQEARDGRKGLAARSGRPGVKLDLDYKSQERIDGQEGVKARELARLSPSTSPGGSRWEKKWQRVQSALENFTPEVRPGNQTALGTRADPFALYVARMHRKIHKLWGFGFLVDLDAKPDSNPMNDMSLWAMIEVVVEPNGNVAKASIVRPSGLLTYDVAALDTVFSSAPYEPTPRAIRSADGRVYLHWRFHRDQRQCGTFGVDPFILTTPPKGPIDNPATEVTGQSGGPGRELRRLHPGPGSGHRHYHVAPSPQKSPASGDRKQRPPDGAPAPGGERAGPAAARVDPRDPAAAAALQGFLQAFSNGNPTRMAAACGLPFSTDGRPLTRDRIELARMFKDLLAEEPGREVSGRLLTVAQVRSELGRLPRGVEHGHAVLVGLATLGATPVTLLVSKTAGGWRVIGLNR